MSLIPRVLLSLLLLGASFDAALAKKCKVTGANPDPDIVLSVVDTLVLGTFTRPDFGGGTANLTLSPVGSRILPPNLSVNDPSKDIYRPARLQVTGGPTCEFRIDLATLTGTLTALTVSAGSGYVITNSGGTTISTGGSNTRGVLDATGRFEFYLGLTTEVTDTSTTATVGGSVNVTITYSP